MSSITRAVSKRSPPARSASTAPSDRVTKITAYSRRPYADGSAEAEGSTCAIATVSTSQPRRPAAAHGREHPGDAGRLQDMTPADLRAIAQHLKSIPPVRNKIE